LPFNPLPFIGWAEAGLTLPPFPGPPLGPLPTSPPLALLSPFMGGPPLADFEDCTDSDLDVADPALLPFAILAPFPTGAGV